MSKCDLPNSFVELFHWCKTRARELAPRLSQEDGNLTHEIERIQKHLKVSTAAVGSDGDERPATQFCKEFRAHLDRLKYSRSSFFSLKSVGEARVTVVKPVPENAERFENSRDGERIRRARWRTAQGEVQVSDIAVGEDGVETVNELVDEIVKTIRLTDVCHRAKALCRRSMVSFHEIPAGWDNDDLPAFPLRTVRDLTNWLMSKLDLLDEIASCQDGDEPILNAKEFGRAIAKYKRSNEYRRWNEDGIISGPTDSAVVALRDALRPLEEFHQSRFWLEMSARQPGTLDRILRQAIRGANLWLDSHRVIDGRPLIEGDLEAIPYRAMRNHLVLLMPYLQNLDRSSISKKKIGDFMELIVDRDQRTVQRVGYDAKVEFGNNTGEWSLFLALFDAGAEELTQEQLSQLPGENNAEARRQTKVRLKNRLSPLEITIPSGEWRLTEA